jgi:integrase
MIRVNYYLKNALSEKKLLDLKKTNANEYQVIISKQYPILLSLCMNSERIKLHIGKSIELKYWDFNLGNIKNSNQIPREYSELRLWLDSKKLEIQNQWQQGNFIFESNYIKQLFQSNYFSNEYWILNPNSEGSVYRNFISNYKIQTGFCVHPNTAKKYKSLFNHLSRFTKSPKLVITKITESFVIQFIEYLSRNNCTDTTICKYIKAFKTVVNYYEGLGIKFPIYFDKIKVMEHEQSVITLTKEEIDKLIIFNNLTQREIEVLDVFMFQTYTGARYGDIYKIMRNNIVQINGNKYWKYVAEKTNYETLVPLNKAAIKILENYQHLYYPLPRIALQNFNKIIKEVARKAGLDRMVEKVYFIKGNLKKTSEPLHNVISSHVARKTFITLSLSLNVQEREIRTITGHKSEKSFRRYVNYNEQMLLNTSTAWDKAFSF